MTKVLILCTHWANKLGKDVRAYSAGSAPSGRLNPFALEAALTAIAQD